MIRLLASAVVGLIANSVALIVGALLLPDMTLDGLAFFIALLVFTGTELIIEPLIRQSALRRSPALLGSTSLVATLIALIVTVLFTDGLQISGGLTWIMATVIVWLAALLTKLVLPLLIFRDILKDARNN